MCQEMRGLCATSRPPSPPPASFRSFSSSSHSALHSPPPYTPSGLQPTWQRRARGSPLMKSTRCLTAWTWTTLEPLTTSTGWTLWSRCGCVHRMNPLFTGNRGGMQRVCLACSECEVWVVTRQGSMWGYGVVLICVACVSSHLIPVPPHPSKTATCIQSGHPPRSHSTFFLAHDALCALNHEECQEQQR